MVVKEMLDIVFGPLTSLPDVYAITIVAAFVSFVFSGSQRIMVDQTQMKDLKNELKKLKEKTKKLRKDKNDKELARTMSKNMQLAQKQLMMTIKPLLLSMLIVLFIFNWLKITYSEFSMGLPFGLPFIGESIGWLGLYILISIPSTILFRKILKLE